MYNATISGLPTEYEGNNYNASPGIQRRKLNYVNRYNPTTEYAFPELSDHEVT